MPRKYQEVPTTDGVPTISGSEESLSYEYETYSVHGSTYNPFDEDLELELGNPFAEETDSGVMVDVLEQSPYLVKKLVDKIDPTSPPPPSKKRSLIADPNRKKKNLDPEILKNKIASSKAKEKMKEAKKKKEFAELEVAMSQEQEGKKAKCLLYCLKSYCIIFVIFIVSLGLYMAADASRNTIPGLDQRDGDATQTWMDTGYRQLRIGSRRIYFRSCEAVGGMANHSVLLVHGNSGTGEMFNKLGTMQFLRDHGARAVAIDVIGFGKSDPPMHILESYEGFFTEVVGLFELEYNLVLVCVEEGCDKVLPYYLNHGVYSSNNSFIEGAVFISPRGDSYNKYVKPEKQRIPTAARTLIVNGGKDEFLNLDVSNSLALVPRSEIHPLPDLKNNFYRSSRSKSYFHAALQAFIDGLEYAYDRELQEIVDHENGYDPQQADFSNQQAGYNQGDYNNQQNGYNQPIQDGYNQQVAQGGYNQQGASQGGQYNQIGGDRGQSSSGGGYQQSSNGGGYHGGGYNNKHIDQGDAFSRFNAKQKGTFQDMSYNPANRFSSLKKTGEK